MLLFAHLLDADCDYEDVQSFMMDHFQGRLHRLTQVPEVSYRNDFSEQLWDLSLHLSATVEQSIVQHFQQIPVSYNVAPSGHPICEKSGTTKLSIETFPTVLQLHLKRFKYGTSATKVTDYCAFSDILDFHALLGVESPKYCLHSVLVHSGTLDQGHYFVYIRPNIRNDDWFKFDDDKKVVKVTKTAAIDENFGVSGRGTRGSVNIPTAYMLIYIKDTAIEKLFDVPTLDVSYNEDTLRSDLQNNINSITRMDTHRAELMGDAFFSGFGQTILDNLSHIVDEMPPFDDVDYFNRVAEACTRLVEIADGQSRSALRTNFVTDCQSLICRCEKELSRDSGKGVVGTHKLPSTVLVAVSALPMLPSIHPNPKPASAARFAHAHPYQFPPHLKFDLSFFPPSSTVSTTTASSLFAEFKRVSDRYTYVQYADDHYNKSAKKEERHLCLSGRPATTIKNLLFIGSDTLDWFFVSLATLYPDVLVLSNFLIHWNLQFGQQFSNQKFSWFVSNVKDRRPKFVLHPLNLPARLDQACDKHANPGYHFVLTFIEFDWSQSQVSSKIIVLDPFSDDMYIDAAVQLYKKGNYFSSFNPVFEKRQIKPIQLGDGNIHCGVYVLALALNAVFGTLDTMDERLNPERSEDTCEQGLLLRKFVAWDCTQFPSLLDTFLLACPRFSPIPNRSLAVKASAWWVQTPYHNIADSLTIKYGTIFKPVKPTRNGTFGEQDRVAGNHELRNSTVPSDGPFFFSDGKVLVKVNCIGLIGHRLAGDRKAAIRAALAFQECCSTPFVCSKKGWFFETFGLICVGLVCPCAFVCIARTLGTLVQNEDASPGRSFHDLSSLQFESSSPKASVPLRVMHGDPHRKNKVLVDSQVQLIDFDKTILITGECPPLFLFTWYAASIAEQPRNPFHIRALMRIIGRSGQDATHAFFAQFYTSDTFLSATFDADLFEKSPKTHWEYDAFLHLFQLLFEKGLEPKLVSDCQIVLNPSGSIHINFDERRSGIITVSCENSQLQAVHLGSESDTSTFFEQFLNHVAATQEQQQQQQQEALQQQQQPRGQAEPTISFDGLRELMQLLSQEASRYNDRAPLLDKSFISCEIRPVCSRDKVVPCQIFFERSATGAINIHMAAFQHDKHQYLQENFTKTRVGLSNLKDKEEVRKFFDFALSMKEIYGSLSSGSSDEESSAIQVTPTDKPFFSAARSASLGLRQLPRVPAHDWLYYKMLSCGNPNVLNSVRESMMRRFGTAGKFTDLTFKEKSKSNNALRQQHFGCESVLVNDDSTRKRCIQFIQSQGTLSFDTETAVPNHKGDGISLIQIGLSTNVFIIQVRLQPAEFFTSLGDSLVDKTLVCWGNDKTELQKIVTARNCVFVDLQHEYSDSKLKGLADCIEDLFDGMYILNKDWRLSGWDNDSLTRGQLSYAALDVVCCHALYIASKKRVHILGGRDSVYCKNGKHITFYALNSDSSGKFKRVEHGFAYAPDFLGHYNNGSVSHGFRFSKSPPLPQGFKAFDDASHRHVSLNVRDFENLLNDSKFCCSLCSSCWDKQSNRSNWRISSDITGDKDEQKANACVSMLASFFQLQVSAENLQGLKNSVCSDIYYGYIRETLAYLLPADASQSCAVNVGQRFSASADFFGHYEANTAIRGFRLAGNLVHPKGFKAASCHCDLVSNLIDAFTVLLNSKHFCCERCRESFPQQLSPIFLPAALKCGQCYRSFDTTKSESNGGQPKCSACVRSFGIKKSSKVALKAVAFDENTSLNMNDAVFCLSMLGAFFDLKFEIGENLLYSVHSDVHDGYISKTLAYLVAPPQ